MEIVDYDHGVKGLHEYLSQLLFGKVICENIRDAYQIQRLGINEIKEIYTIDGNIIKKDGAVTANGNPENLRSKYKYKNNKLNIYQDLNKLHKQKEGL